ncbi:hypothetical protein ACPCGN_26215 [Methylobacterium sp. NPDC014790]|uniref:hypothetical protein n=1 Tax=Methylobacterium sp. NPDC014790 TaxID=3364153 RepID=UPI003C2E7915
MSTMRRQLGPGPTTSTKTKGSLRLLPAERIALIEGEDYRAVEREEQKHADAKGRRRLGTGPQ